MKRLYLGRWLMVVAIAAMMGACSVPQDENSENPNFKGLYQDENGTVFVTASGDKYHTETCSHVKDKIYKTDYIKVTVDSAELKGFMACKVCKPNKKR